MDAPLGSFRGLLARYVRPLAGTVALLGVLLGVSIVLQLAQPQVLRAFLDAATGATKPGSPTYLRDAALLFIVLAVIQQGAAVLATYFSERVGWAATNALREDLMRHCLRLDLSFHKARTPGELIERIDGDVTAMANFFAQFTVQLAGNAILFLGVVLVMAREDWRGAVGLVIFGVVTVGTMVRLRGLTVPFWRRSRETSADLFGYIEERLGGTEDLRSSGAERYVIYRLFPFMRRRVQTVVVARIVGALQWTVPNLLFTLMNGAYFIYVAWLYRVGDISLGTGFLILNYVGISFRPIRMISQQMEEFQKASAGIIRVGDLLRERSQLVSGSPEVALPAGALDVEFDHVTFGYQDAPAEEREVELILRDVSFHLEPGKALGLLGRTGSGKTTITRLLFRFYDPVEGVIRLGGVDAATVTPPRVRERIGLVTQDVQLFRASVRDNVTLFDVSIGDERIRAAFDDLGLAAWYAGLSSGLDTILGADGIGLSAGEAQLLAFTRVFLRDPGLIILDEASSRLDPVTERLIDQAVARLLRGRSAIIIAHRLSTIGRVDNVLILEHGHTVEYGARAALAADPGSRLYGLLRAGLEHMDDDTVAVPAGVMA
jgi:ATP-binding cassette, subfamily B, bacterial